MADNVIKQKVNKFFKIIFASRALYKRAVLFGFSSVKRWKLYFLFSCAASASLVKTIA